MMLLFPPSETSSTIDICMVEGKPTCVGRVYTGGDVCHEGASFWSHYASYKLMLRGILSFLLSSQPPSSDVPYLPIFLLPTLSPSSHCSSFHPLLSSAFYALVTHLTIFSICECSAKCTCAGLSQRYPEAILYFGPCYWLLDSVQWPPKTGCSF